MSWRRIAKLVVSVVLVSLAGALVVASSARPTGYEVSIYRSTPATYWVLILGALFTSLVCGVFAEQSRYRYCFGLLAGLSVCSILFLPLVRRYFFYGPEDPMTHLAHVAEILRHGSASSDLFYPGMHVLGAIAARVPGLSSRTALVFVTLWFAVIWLVAFPLLVRLVRSGPGTVMLALGVAIPIVPVNQISTVFQTHPSSQMVLYAPVPLYLYFKAYRSKSTEFKLLFTTSLAVVIVYHPLQAIVLSGLFLGITTGQLFVSRFVHGGGRPSLTWMTVSVCGVGVATWITLQNSTRFLYTLRGLLLSILVYSPRDTIASRGSSLSHFGMSLLELGLRLASKALVLVPVVLLGFYVAVRKRDSVALSTGIGMIPVAGIMGVLLAGGFFILFTRVLGIVSVVISLFAVFGLLALYERSRSTNSRLLYRVLVAGVLVASAGAAVPVYHYSGYMLQPTQHVPESSYQGFETTFEHADPSDTVLDVRTNTRRYLDVMYGPDNRPTVRREPGQRTPRTPDHFADHRLADAYPDRYLVITSRDRLTETSLYQGFRFDSADFRYLEKTPTISRLYDNGEFTLYRTAQT